MDNREYMIKILSEQIAMFPHIPSIDNGQLMARDIYDNELKARKIHWRRAPWRWSQDDWNWLIDYSVAWMEDYRKQHP